MNAADEPNNSIELYRRDEMIEALQKEWHMALAIFNKMGWQPARPLEAYAYPLTFITHDEAKAMEQAGLSLFALIKEEPFVSTSIQIDCGLLYRLTEFVEWLADPCLRFVRFTAGRYLAVPPGIWPSDF